MPGESLFPGLGRKLNRELDNAEPHPDAANHTKYLRGDGTFGTPAGTGATELVDLNDVDPADLQDGSVLQYDGNAEKFVMVNELRGGNF